LVPEFSVNVLHLTEGLPWVAINIELADHSAVANVVLIIRLCWDRRCSCVLQNWGKEEAYIFGSSGSPPRVLFTVFLVLADGTSTKSRDPGKAFSLGDDKGRVGGGDFLLGEIRHQMGTAVAVLVTFKSDSGWVEFCSFSKVL